MKSPPVVYVALALVVTWFIWGTTYLAIKIALTGFSPLTLSAVRFLLAGMLLCAVKGRCRPTGRQLRHSAVVGTLLFVLSMGGVAAAEQYVDSSTAALVISTVPLWSSLLHTSSGGRPHPLEWAGVAGGVLGVFVLFLGSHRTGSSAALLVLMVAAVSWSYGSFLDRRYPSDSDASLQMITGGVLLLVASVLHGDLTALRAPHWDAALALGYLVVFGSVVVMTAYRHLSRNAPPSLATSYAFVSPVVAVLSGALLLGERLTRQSLMSCALVALAVVCTGWGSRRNSARLRPAPSAPSHRERSASKAPHNVDLGR
ncbi:EamA family transporter [Streptomyces sp. NPDC058086]|uniref:EamA family transporter n=1 Tax=Streptomyces sp. NPDC058086 TaxID=3346334 RepID=UPI0036F02C2F